MPVLGIFRSTLVTLSVLAFSVSVLLLVSSAPMGAATLESAALESALLVSAEPEAATPAPMQYLQAGFPVFDQLAPETGEAGSELVSFVPPVSGQETPDGGMTPSHPVRESVLDRNQILAFYGKPGASSMGILGEYTKEQLAPFLEAYAKLYDEANGERGMVPAFYIIYGTCWPDGEIGILRRSVIEEYIEFAAQRGWLVFLDHQIGRYDVEHAVSLMLPFLQYPNVHLALDPEWRTLKPMQDIGYVTGNELNVAQAMIEDYLVEHDLPGKRMLVVHQFTNSMIRQREVVEAGFDRVTLVHTADGFGSPALKRHSYGHNAKAANIPVKGFKLFFESKVPGAGWDSPLMMPEEVLALEPLPLVIMYQ
jgi:hypothetical protein